MSKKGPPPENTPALPVQEKIKQLEQDIDALYTHLQSLPLADQLKQRGQLGILIRRWQWYQSRLPVLLRNQGRGSHQWIPAEPVSASSRAGR